jgi:hypothetical protein
MKSPAELQTKLRRQWENGTLRETRLLGAENAWPLVASIGRPSPRRVRTDLDAVKRHVEAWRRVTIGEVIWEAVPYRATDSSVAIPIGWKLRKPSEWIEACNDGAIRREYEALATLVEGTDSVFHSTLVRRRSLWRETPAAEVIQAARLAGALDPGCAGGRPLRTLSIEGIDTKFFERHERLITALLDVRFDGEASKIGLATFLGVPAEGDHWLLVVDLDGGLLPFQRQRVRSSELRDAVIPGERLLIVENESCQHHLPCVPKTVAVLGSGFDLDWIASLRPANKRVAYWGDIDTWGLHLLSKARAVGDLDALMMTSEVYERFAEFAVPEPVVAGTELPKDLTESEQLLYRRLPAETRGRLEQEFLPEAFVRETILNWANNSSSGGT